MIKIHVATDGSVNLECDNAAQAMEVLKGIKAPETNVKRSYTKKTVPATNVDAVTKSAKASAAQPKKHNFYKHWTNDEIKFVVENLDRRVGFMLRSPLAARHGTAGVSWMYYYVRNILAGFPRSYSKRTQSQRVIDMVQEIAGRTTRVPVTVG